MDTQEKLSKTKQSIWKPRASCWIVAALVLVPAWALVAIPGNHFSSNYGRTETHEFIHGWPLTHAISVRADYPESLAFQEINIESTAEALKILRERMDRVAQETLDAPKELSTSPPLINHRLVGQQPATLPANSDFEVRGFCGINWSVCELEPQSAPPFWSALENWPLPDGQRGFAIGWNTFALMANLSVIAIATFVLAIAFEFRRRRRGSWFRLSVFEFLLTVAAIAVSTAAFKSEYDRSVRELETVADFKKLEVASLYAAAIRRNNLPPVLLELSNNQQSLPGTDVQLWNPLVALRVDFGFPSHHFLESQHLIEQAINALANFECPVYIEVRNHRWEILEKLQTHNIEKIGFTYDSRFTGFFPFGQGNENHKPADQFVDALNRYTELSAIELMLCSTPEQNSQLEPFFDSSIVGQLKTIEIWGVEESGAKYLLTLDQRIAEKTRIKLGPNVSDSLIETLAAAGFEIIDRGFFR